MELRFLQCPLVSCVEIDEQFDSILENLQGLHNQLASWQLKIDSIWRCQNETIASVGYYNVTNVCECYFHFGWQINDLKKDLMMFNDNYINATQVFGWNICNGKIC